MVSSSIKHAVVHRVVGCRGCSWVVVQVQRVRRVVTFVTVRLLDIAAMRYTLRCTWLLLLELVGLLTRYWDEFSCLGLLL